MLFRELSEQWLKVKKLDIGKSQYIAYKCALKHLQPILDRDIQTIRVNDIQAVIAALAAHNPNTGKPTAKKTLRDVKHTAKQILQYGIDCQYLTYNAAQAVKIPRKAPQKTRRALTSEEIKKITDTPHSMRTAAMIMMYAGLRRGEVIPLLWSDIDLVNGYITVNKAVDLTDNSPIIKTPKTDAGTRIVHMPNVLKSYLQTICKSDGLVISEKMLSKMMWIKRWEKYTADLGLQDVTAHNLRHTACSMMIEAGMDVKSVQMQMGHADIQTTLDIYTHITNKHRAAEVEKLDLYLKNIAS